MTEIHPFEDVVAATAVATTFRPSPNTPVQAAVAVELYRTKSANINRTLTDTPDYEIHAVNIRLTAMRRLTATRREDGLGPQPNNSVVVRRPIGAFTVLRSPWMNTP